MTFMFRDEVEKQACTWSELATKLLKLNSIAAVSCSPDAYRLGGAGFGFGMTGKLGRAWCRCMGGAWVHGYLVAWVGGWQLYVGGVLLLGGPWNDKIFHFKYWYVYCVKVPHSNESTINVFQNQIKGPRPVGPGPVGPGPFGPGPRANKQVFPRGIWVSTSV